MQAAQLRPTMLRQYFSTRAGIALLDQGEFQLGGHFAALQATFTNEGSHYNLPNTPVNGLRLSGGNGGDGGVAHLLPNTQPKTADPPLTR